MAALSLTCPLCCNETFPTHNSLKSHILSYLDNLICPSCNEQCDDLMDLADHLGRECINLEDNCTQKLEAPEQADLGNGTIEEVQEDPIKEEVLDILEEQKGDFHDTENTYQEESEITNDTSSSTMYNCQMCKISFSSVKEHLAKYHEGEEVLLETDEQDEQIEEYPEGLEAANEENQHEMYADDGPFIDNEDSDGFRGMHQNADGDYKVENIWVKENEGPPLPTTTKYIVENGKVKKITENEASKIEDKSSIIEVHSCINCNLQFPNLSHFQKHKCSNANHTELVERKKKEHYLKLKENLKYQCTFCLATYVSLVALNDHMKSHLVQDESGMVQKKTITMTLHSCEACNIKFPTFKQLRLHSRMHEPVKEKEVDPPVGYNLLGQTKETNDSDNGERETFHCTTCDKSYDKEYEEVHMKSHQGTDNIVCLVCNRRFENRDNLEMHMKAHSNTKKFACSYCKKPFTTYKALEYHSLHQCQKREYECQYCGRRFARPHEKVKHERIHTGEKPHLCRVCGKSFRVSYCLTLHMRTHSGTRPYTCQHCGKRFKSYSVFNHHIATHSDERNYKCPFCLKAFKTAVQLAGHKNSHTKPFSCTECNRPFASLYAVKAHMETHKRNNNLKFDCWLCGASYARSFALRDHMHSVHEGASIAPHNENVLESAEQQDEQEQVYEEQGMLAEEAENEEAVCEIVEGEEGEEYVVHVQEIEENEHQEQMEVNDGV